MVSYALGMAIVMMEMLVQEPATAMAILQEVRVMDVLEIGMYLRAMFLALE